MTKVQEQYRLLRNQFRVLTHKLKISKIFYFLHYPLYVKKTRKCLEDKSSLLNDNRIWTTATNKLVDVGEEILSVIIPTYNCGDRIAGCLESILSQNTQYLYRIIVVDDGSTDHTKAVLKQYVDNDKILYHYQQNKGVAAARNQGILLAKSKYIMFIDADDRMVGNAIEVMISKAIAENADIVECNYLFSRGKKTVNVTHSFDEGISSSCKVWGVPWAKVYRLSLFENVAFPVGYIYEDSIIPMVIAAKAKKIVYVEECFYEYISNESGISYGAYRSNRLLDTVFVFFNILEHMGEYDISPTSDLYEFCLVQMMINEQRISCLHDRIQKEVFLKSADLLDQYFGNIGTRTKQGSKIDKMICNRRFLQFKMYSIYYFRRVGLMWIKQNGN